MCQGPGFTYGPWGKMLSRTVPKNWHLWDLKCLSAVWTFFLQNFIHIIYIFWQCIFNNFLEHIMLLILHFTLPGQNTVTSIISSYKYQYCKYRTTIWTDLSNSNSSRPISPTPQCTRQTSHNAPLRTEMCPSPLWMMCHHHWGHHWLSVQITFYASWHLAHRLKDVWTWSDWCCLLGNVGSILKRPRLVNTNSKELKAVISKSSRECQNFTEAA